MSAGTFLALPGGHEIVLATLEAARPRAPPGSALRSPLDRRSRTRGAGGAANGSAAIAHGRASAFDWRQARVLTLGASRRVLTAGAHVGCARQVQRVGCSRAGAHGRCARQVRTSGAHVGRSRHVRIASGSRFRFSCWLVLALLRVVVQSAVTAHFAPRGTHGPGRRTGIGDLPSGIAAAEG
jgi:hypothetical protein